MKIKKFVGPTLKEASEKMKQEFSNEAIILGTRMVTKDGPGGQYRVFEITSGIDDGSSPSVINREKTLARSVNMVEEIKDSVDTGKAKNIPNNKLFNIIDKGKKEQKSCKSVATNNWLFNAESLLKHMEVEKPIIKSIMRNMDKTKTLINSYNLENHLVSNIASLVSTSHFEFSKNGRQKAVAMVGPTGVGKTTCIAKLAAISKILDNLNVGIISIDTYRLGAIDQLRIFSELSNIDMLVAYEPEDMPKLMNKLRNKDIIFIDTVGRSQKNLEDLKKTKQYLNQVNINETYLVLSSTSSTKTLSDIAKKFQLMNYDSFIFSKIDEGVTFGNLLNVMVKFNVPVTYLTNGQVIPDDILSADAEFIANLIYSGKIQV